jgi:hypothetical protein
MSRDYKELLIVLDQFEEFFVFWPEAERINFVNALADCYEDNSLPARFVIALRKDYHADLDIFEQRIPSVFVNHFRLHSMGRAEAQMAVTRPIARLSQNVT